MNKRNKKGKTICPIILEIPISYEKLMEYRMSNYNRIEEILSEIPVSLFDNNKEPIKSNNIVLDNNETKLNSNIKKYNNVDNCGKEYNITIYDINSILETKLDSKQLERIKVMKTDISCWWCCHQFNTFPVCAPIKYESKYDIFKVKGCFCSFNCVKSYLYSTKVTDHSLVSFLQKRILGKHMKTKQAPPKEILKKFGGSIGIEEYRESFNTLTEYNQNIYPMIYIPYQLEKRKTNDNDKKLADKNIEYYKSNKIKTKTISNVRINKTTDKKIQNTNSLSKMFGLNK